MNKYELIRKYNEVIFETYKEHALTSLRGLEDKFEVNGRQIVEWYFNTTRQISSIREGLFNNRKNFDDLIICSDELLYFTAHLFLYRPFINNPVNDGYFFYGEMIYPNLQNLEAKRYNMFVDVASQKAYNYWDRLGDLIASMFPDRIKAHNIYFSTAIDTIPSQYHNSDNYIWLKEFKESAFMEMNKKRKEIVHYTTSDTTFKHKHLELLTNKAAMQALHHEREQIADFYKEHISLTLSGFEKTMLFIEDVLKN